MPVCDRSYFMYYNVLKVRCYGILLEFFDIKTVVVIGLYSGRRLKYSTNKASLEDDIMLCARCKCVRFSPQTANIYQKAF